MNFSNLCKLIIAWKITCIIIILIYFFYFRFVHNRTFFNTHTYVDSVIRFPASYRDAMLHAWKIYACPFDATYLSHCIGCSSNLSEQNYEFMNISPPVIGGDARYNVSLLRSFEIISCEYFNGLSYIADFGLILMLSAIWIVSAQLHLSESDTIR